MLEKNPELVAQLFVVQKPVVDVANDIALADNGGHTISTLDFAAHLSERAVDARRRCVSDKMHVYTVVSHIYDWMESLGSVTFGGIWLEISHMGHGAEFQWNTPRSALRTLPWWCMSTTNHTT